jgi:hypothetical protein
MATSTLMPTVRSMAGMVNPCGRQPG